MTVDVFQHHDGIIDDEAHRDGQRHQRQIIQTVVQQEHHGERADQRHRNGDRWDDGCPYAAQEQEDHHHHETDGQHQGELHIMHRGADGLRPVHHDADMHARRDCRLEPRQRRLDPLDGVDDVRAGLLEDLQHDAALAVLPRRQLLVLRTIDRLTDVAHAHRRAVAIGKDDVVVFGRLGELVVVVDRVSAILAVDRALRGIHRGIHQREPRMSSSVMPIAASLAGSTCTRTARFCSPPMNTCDTPAICEICCARTVSA